MRMDINFNEPNCSKFGNDNQSTGVLNENF